MKDLQKKLNYHFRDESLLDRALRHRSSGTPNNERLEFLGDSVLGFIIAEELYKRHEDALEGDLSRMRSSLVNGQILASLAKQLNLPPHLNLGVGEEKTGGRERESILADAVEAIIAAIYLDGGMDAARTCVLRWYGDLVADLASLTPQKDAKTQLQEWTQAHKYPLPVYQAHTSGKSHKQEFTVSCLIEGLPHKTLGKSSSRRKAEQIAAEKYLEQLRHPSESED